MLLEAIEALRGRFVFVVGGKVKTLPYLKRRQVTADSLWE